MGKEYKTSIGGQAVIEGVMMKGPAKSAMAVRKPDNSVHLETWDNPPKRAWNKIPFIRGIFNFIDTMLSGYRCLMKSAEISVGDEEDEEPESKFEIWLDKVFGKHLTKIVTVLSAILGVAIAVGLFMYLPALLVGLLKTIAPSWSLSIIEGLIKITLFILYLAAVSRMKEMKRMFQYHGAEHKTIACYEHGEELTVENIKKHTRFHPRCGTSFLFLVLAIGILIFSVVTWSSPLIRTLLKLALLPVVVSIAYELIRLAGRYDNWFTKIISFPGLKIQHLTTVEPDDSQIEIAIASMKPVMPEKQGEDRW